MIVNFSDKSTNKSTLVIFVSSEKLNTLTSYPFQDFDFTKNKRKSHLEQQKRFVMVLKTILAQKQF